MPFLFAQKGRKTHGKSRAYLAPSPTEVSRLSWQLLQDLGYQTPPTNKQWLPLEEEMGYKTPKQPAGAPKDTRDIGTLLQRPTSHKMVAEPDMETGSNCSAMSPEDQEEHQQSQSQHTPQGEGDDMAPATKRDIRQFLQEVKQMYEADLNKARTEIQAVTTRVQAMEDNIIDLRQEVNDMGHTLRQLQSANTAVQRKLDTIENRSRQKKF
ncbi:Hypothetical predicted protein [Pelobates cultripes]|uniref:Uncharacterized protein n=1 Tax=Pelobates cultripes TaxID=61616 RepID=A0AAD1RA54_PELCU|nr:Hypothetical predicted protein [Pelobates cultripes]